MSEEISKEKIYYLSQELERAEYILKNKDTLTEQRIRIERELKKSASALTNSEYSTHQHLGELKVERGAPDPHEKSRKLLISELESQRNSFTKLKEKMKEIDHLLDELEEDLEEKITQVREELLHSILKTYPEELHQYEKNQQRIAEAEALAFELENLSQSMKNTEEFLEKSLGLWERSKWRGLWHFFFGRSPYTLISDQMKLAAKHAEHSLSLLSRNPLEGFLKTNHLFNPLKTHLEEVYKHCKDRWRYRRFDTTYPPLFERLNHLTLEVTTHLRTKQQDIAEAETKTREWIREKSQSSNT